MRKMLLCLAALCLMMAFGCSKDNKTETAANAKVTDSTKKIKPKLATLKLDTSNMDCEKLDMNNDGKVDQKVYTKKGDLQFVIRDFNFDGLTDMTEFFKNGVHYRDEIDLDYDGVCDLIVTYHNDKPVKKEFSNDFEGNRHGVQIFDENGNRTEIHRDLNSDGLDDVIEYYHPNEEEPYNIVRIAPPETEKTDATSAGTSETSSAASESTENSSSEAVQTNSETQN